MLMELDKPLKRLPTPHRRELYNKLHSAFPDSFNEIPRVLLNRRVRTVQTIFREEEDITSDNLLRKVYDVCEDLKTPRIRKRLKGTAKTIYHPREVQNRSHVTGEEAAFVTLIEKNPDWDSNKLQHALRKIKSSKS